MATQQSRCTSVTFFGVRSGVGVTTLAVNVAAILGVVARRKTLLLDLSGNGRGVSSALGIPGDRGLLSLTTPFLMDGHVSPDELTRQIVRYEPGEPWPAGVSALDVLPGFDRAGLSAADEQRLHAYYGVALVRAVCESACLAEYEFVLADGGVGLREKIGLGMLRDSAQAFLVSSPEESDVFDIGDPLGRMRARGWHTRVVFNQSHKLRFEFKYRNDVFLEQSACTFVPPAEGRHLEESRIRGLPAALLGLQGVERRLSKFASGCVGAACLIDQRLKGELRDYRGRPLRA
jgi:MinD-like ATPase involved in chromosome partitioning or flagellar assembly